MSLASSVAEHHAAPQALPLVVTWRRALPSLSELPAGKGVSDLSGSHPPAANPSTEQPPGGAGSPTSLAAACQAGMAAEGCGSGICPGLARGAQPGLILCSCGGAVAAPVPPQCSLPQPLQRGSTSP